MNTELLREDEREMYEWLNRDYRPLHKNDSYLLLERLVEEREKREYTAFVEDERDEYRSELAEARKDSERLDWLFKVGDAAQHNRAAIDAAMKEYYNNL